ncbi:thioesterase family protein [Glycomyces endophyticus]|uniref:Thioesterase family protein n=1 Tax=Glycomyces endophyticus TaxID=480996 RepID=A0ABN2HH48_9ACTN
MTEPNDGYFVRLDQDGDRARFRPTPHTEGAWNPAEQHISPMNGLIVHEIERLCAARGPDGMAISRLSADILGVLTLDPFEVGVRVVRPGRTIELLEAEVVSGGRPAVRARVWRTIAQDTEKVAGGEDAPLAAPETLAPFALDDVWPGGYIRSLDARPVREPQPGRSTVWVRAKVPVAAGEDPSDLARLIGLVDSANGVAVRQSPREWLFPNVDLTVHLFRQPAGRWLGLDTTVVFGPGGLGLTSSDLHDEAGHFGRAEQALTIRPR